MDTDLVERIANHPKYKELKTRRTRLGWTLTAMMLIVYYGFIALIAFGIIGTAVGVALREELFMGILLALSVLVGGFLVVGALILLWRSFCELYVAIFRLSDDLHAMRQAVDAENSVRPPASQRKA